MWQNWRHRAAAFVGVSALGVYAIDATNERRIKGIYIKRKVTLINEKTHVALPKRSDMLARLKDQEYDVLVIGGGATGAGLALDATTRGLKAGLVEYGDFGSATSSKSTKLLHGGVKYFEKALLQGDLEQYRIVKRGLEERTTVMRIAPHLTNDFQMFVPAYEWWQLPYFWGGAKSYDFFSGNTTLRPSRFVSRNEAKKICPMIKTDGLKGAFVYYDGQQNDARLVLANILTAVRHGADCVNYTEVIGFLKNDVGQVNGVIVRDKQTLETYHIRAKVVINATGPFTDTIRKMDDKECKKMIVNSSGIHFTLPKHYCPSPNPAIANTGAKESYVLLIPWENRAIVGLTDHKADLTFHPKAEDKAVDIVLEEMNNILNKNNQIRKEDIISVWSGIRALVLDPTKTDTKTLARNHVIEVAPSGLVTIAGGKITTYRQIAEETLDKALEVGPIQTENDCITKRLALEGSHDWHPTFYRNLIEKYGIAEDTAIHLAKTIEIDRKKRLHPKFPIIEGEVRYAVREYAQEPADFLARRTRLSFLDTEASIQALPKIVAIMAEELGWSPVEQKKMYEKTLEFLNIEMGSDYNGKIKREVKLTKKESDEINRRFKLLDSRQKGYISKVDLGNYLKTKGIKVDENILYDVVSEASEIDGYLTIQQFEKIYLNAKSGKSTGRRLVDYVNRTEGPLKIE
ncbi:unnamed protein product [Caenorhabditis angaria]|uniref:Glycerol-3-phosphate dehydrogenase n=1 Tax=Caenorhabditis angaria TaxID=860376 RepID=A0A9P1IYD5_9PELO|nr:unnamed protein product [Caenorhabditis angaria]